MFGKNPIYENSSIINDIYQSIISEEIQKRKNINEAILTYEKIGFHRVGIIPKGFLLKNGNYEDIIIYYIEL